MEQMKCLLVINQIFTLQGKNGCFTANVCDANKQRTHCKRIHAEDTLWTGTPGNYTNPNAPEALLEVRKLVDSGKFSEATSKAVQLTGNPAEVLFFFLSMAALLHIAALYM